MTNTTRYSLVTLLLLAIVSVFFTIMPAFAQVTTSQSVNCTVPPRNLSYGFRTSADVSALQSFLLSRGYFTSATVGPFGPQTLRAVLQFQRDNNVSATGFVGPLTRAAMSRWCNPSSASVQSLSPSVGPVGTTVTVTGSGFTADNTVAFGSGVVMHVASSNGTSLTFQVPSGLDPRCRFSSPPCAILTRQTTPGTYAVSVENTNGTSNALTFTVTAADVTPTTISIQSISPTSGPVGTQVTLTGKFFSNDNMVHFGAGVIAHVPINSSIAIACTTDPACVPGIRQTIVFTVPQSVGPYCPPGAMCPMFMQQIIPGTYQVYVTNENGTTNTVQFTVTGGTSSGTLSVTGIDAPASLALGTNGTWTIHATTNTASGNLHYSVVWGDENNAAAASIRDPGTTNVQTSASFTHAYQRSGTYTPTFTVTDDAGHSVTTSATVTVTPLY